MGIFRSFRRNKEDNEEAKEMYDSELGLDVRAIYRARDLINDRIEAGEFTSYEDLKRAVLDEVEFQKIAIRES